MSGSRNPPPPGSDEPPPPYVESSAPLHSNDIPLPSSPIPNVQSTNLPPSYPQPQQTPGYQHSQQHRQPQAAGPSHRPTSQASQSPQSSAQYFASRASTSRQPLRHPLQIRPNTIRADIPYPRNWAPNHDVSLQDWTTFIGFLIPDDAVVPDAKRLSPERKAAVERVIGEWNESFFGPRGVNIVLAEEGRMNADSGFADMPTMDSNHAGPSPGPSSAGPSPAATGSLHHAPSVGSSSGYRPQQSSRDRLMGKLKSKASERDVSFDPQGIRVGSKFSLNAGGLKIGKFKMDQQGMEYGGRPIGPTVPPGSAYGRGNAHSGYPGAGYGPQGPGGRGYESARPGGRGYGPPPTGYRPPEMHGHGRFGPAVGLDTPNPGYGAPPPPNGHQGGPPSPGGMGGYYMPPSGPPPGTPPPAHAGQQTGTLPASQP